MNATMPVPKGLNENSPAFQRRGYCMTECVPTGRLRLSIAFQPSLRDFDACHLQPGVETPGYSRLSLWDRRADSVHLAKRDPR